MLFTAKDFAAPGESKLLRELWQGKRQDVAHLAGRVTLAARGTLLDVPELEAVATERDVKPLAARRTVASRRSARAQSPAGIDPRAGTADGAAPAAAASPGETGPRR